MTVRFTRLSIAGFKSFADPVTVDILPGLTGIVGPNGCGKSNVVEALRWAMGESSARSLRGGEADDLIFAGTTGRAARSVAEVTITIDGAKGLGPAQFAELDELQITRKAERGSGSDYRINGRPARARDVQTLFADLASGARSSAMVSQGRVAALVSARPEERRSILEEAAGITGLHARRHEAELKLRATESNLTRAEDRRQQLSSRLDELADQSRDAARYRELSANLRDAETDLLALLHARARLAVERTTEQSLRARQHLTTREEAAETSIIAEFEANKALPTVREQTDTARTALERCRILAEGMAREEERAQALAQEAAARLAQQQADMLAAQTRLDDAKTTLERLQAEAAEAAEAARTLPDRQEAASQQHSQTSIQLAEAEQALAQLTNTLAEARSRHDRAASEAEQTRLRHEKAQQALQTTQDTLATLQAQIPSQQVLDTARQAAETAAEEARSAATARDAAARQHAQCTVDLSVARNNAEAATQAETELAHTLAQARQRHDALRRELEQVEKRHAEALAARVEASTLLRLKQEVDAAELALAQATEQVDSAEQARLKADTALAEASRTAQEAQSRHNSLTEAARAADSRLRRARQEAETLSHALAQAKAALVDDALLEQARTARAEAEAKLTATGTALEEAEHAQTHNRDQLKAASDTLTAIQAEITRLRAQSEGLAQALGAEEKAASADTPVSTLITVAEDYETALAAALSDELEAPASATSQHGWRKLEPCVAPPLPAGTQPLSSCVTAPPELERVLAFTGLIPDGADGAALQTALAPGQNLVSRAGDLWRWDGFYARSGTAGAAAAHKLAQRRLLRETQARMAVIETQTPAVETQVQNAAKALKEAEQHGNTLRQTRRTQEQALQQARTHESSLERSHATARARLDTVAPQYDRASAAQTEAHTAKEQAEAALQALPPLATLQDALKQARHQQNTAKDAEQTALTRRKQAQTQLHTAREAQSRAEQQNATATTRLETLTPEQDRLRQTLDGESTTLARLTDALATSKANQHPHQALLAAQTALTEATSTLQAMEVAATQSQNKAEATSQHNRQLHDQAQAAQSRLDGLAPRLEEATHQHEEAQSALAAALATLEAAAAAIPADAQEVLDLKQQERAALLAQLDSLRDLRAALQAESASLASSQITRATAQEEWSTRAQAAQTEADTTRQRLEAMQADYTRLAELPAETQHHKQETLKALAEAQARYEQADQARTQAETAQTAAAAQRRVAETELAEAREGVLKAESRQEQANAILNQLLVEHPNPPLRTQMDMTDSAESSLRRKITRLGREREDMGPVNLRADLEAQEASTQAQTLATEMEDLHAAIARLRGSIGSLNKEGRERLMAVFTQVDQHFQALFTRMFGGGRAHLGLVGSDDPLEAGLEIYAQPPGKKLATLSLLSGGEQALTALSLIFAVFRCNPAPVCVLDEVDAPLDDANVERFSALLNDMTAEAGTRFLVVTHHQLTMAHMDRLFGVTMQERGVSRVLSVDLALAASMTGQKEKETPNVTS